MTNLERLKKIKELRKQVNDVNLKFKNIEEELREHDDKYKLLSRPNYLLKKCPHCKSAKNKKCKISGREVSVDSTHKLRRMLFQKEEKEYKNELNKLYAERNEIMSCVSNLRTELAGAEKELKKQEDSLNILKSIKRGNKHKSEIVIECNHYYWKIVKIRNVSGISVGDEIPNKDMSVVQSIMEKDIDVTMFNKNPDTFRNNPFY